MRLFRRRSDPLAPFLPSWSRPATTVIAFAFLAMVFANFLLPIDMKSRVSIGVAWAVIAAAVEIASRLVAASRLHASLRYKWDNRCPGCGYDLTANTTGICSECGKPVRL